MMTITVRISDRCAGHGQCFIHCPEVFEPDGEGYATLSPSAWQGDYEQAVRTAVAACPERAIEIEG
jgi:ferredoxin